MLSKGLVTGRILMKLLVFGMMVVVAAPLSAQQNGGQEFTDPMALLQAVAKNYASAADTFRLESIMDFESSSDLSHQRSRMYRVAIKGLGSQYRIEVRTDFGSLTQISDGTNEWIYQVDTNSYVKRALPPDWPEFPKVMDMAFHEMRDAWDRRTFLEEEALGYKRATMLPDEAIVIEGRRYPCYVVRASSEDSIRNQKTDSRSDVTYWIDKQALVFRKIRRVSDSSRNVSRNLHLPSHTEVTESFPVAEIDPQITTEMFRFTPPADAKEVATLDPDFGGPPRSIHPKAQMVGQIVPEVAFTSPDGKKIELSSWRGKPVLIDFWATWCGSCLLSMPALNRIYSETKGKGFELISVDESTAGDDGATYFERHHYAWTNYHDENKEVFEALKGDAIPLVVLIDAQGKIVYYDFGNNERELRKAIAGLGSEFASIATNRQGSGIWAGLEAHQNETGFILRVTLSLLQQPF
jgi:thiol-disulfide isomerase/thioredoxin/outer membrane lipoprotein-sorting protein